MSNNRYQGGNRGGNNRNNPPNPALARGVAAQPGRDNSQNQEQNPLQAMNIAEFKIDEQGKEIASSVLTRAVEIEQKSCVQLYTTLTQRTKSLAKNGETISAKFSWRLRVGGVRGFREMLLPVFHPVYGIPYIPASSLKGAVRAWARQHHDVGEVDRLLGYINDKNKLSSSIGCVQFLDTFPTKPCLSIDIANPQWHWQNDFSIKYKPEPHAVLSTEKPEFLIGLTATSKGNINNVRAVKEWLEAALKEGIGSRVSAGYGSIAANVNNSNSQSCEFELWTQGMYGASPPTRENEYRGVAEFRPTAIRGILRYWFRTIALGLYSPSKCKELEDTLFGTIQSQTKKSQVVRGTINIKVEITGEEEGNKNYPYFYAGKIVLESKTTKHLNLIKHLLQLSSHMGGIGRGSRRPLHWNNPQMRGCHWELTNCTNLVYSKKSWENFLKKLMELFEEIKPFDSPGSGNPGEPDNRLHDVLNHNSKIYLVRCSELQHPESVDDWRQDGNQADVRGEALEVLYDKSNNFKGKNQSGQGNSKVGGKLETPSYVVIKSNFPSERTPYQVVTIFGADDDERGKFARKFKEMLKSGDAIFINYPIAK